MSLTRFAGGVGLDSLRYHGGLVLLLLAALAVPPILAALLARDPEVALLLGAPAALVAGMGAWGRRRRAAELQLREALVLTALAYPVAALLATPALSTVASPVDALFEAMSGFTTTGLTMLDEAATPASLLFLRAYSQWVGGGGIIVLSLVVLTAPGGTATHLYESEFGTENLKGSVTRTARVVVVVYAAISALAYASLLLAGAGWFDGLLHMLALVSTGGFSPHPDSIGAYGSPAISAVVVAFMLVSAMTIPLYYIAWRRGLVQLWRDRQLRLLLTLSGAGAVVAAAATGWSLADGGASAFNVVSALTGTGFVLRDMAAEPPSTVLVILTYMVFGGATGSTTGGLKLLRVLVIAQLCRRHLTSLLLPRGAKVPVKIGAARVSDADVERAVTILGSYLALALLGAVVLTSTGVGVEDAVFESVSALSTVGLSAGVTGPDLPVGATLVLTAQMWAGRLEFLPVLVLLHPSTWRRKAA